MDEIVVDRETLKALGADTRVEILKSLGLRRKTQAELAEELGIKPPSVKEHLERLASAGLVQLAASDAERKWKYFELTPKGNALVQPPSLSPYGGGTGPTRAGTQAPIGPKGPRVWLLLAIGGVGIVLAVLIASALMTGLVGGGVTVAQSLTMLSNNPQSNALATMYAVNPHTGATDTPVSLPLGVVTLTQAFLREHPGSTLDVRILTATDAQTQSATLADKCGGPVPFASYYQVQASDGEGNRVFVLVRTDNPNLQGGGVACLNVRGAKA